MAKISLIERCKLSKKLIIGGIFVFETLSVIIQVTYFKFTHKRIFLMSPLHHHFEIIYNSETKALKLMILIQILSCIFGLIIFKIFIVK